MLGIAVSWYITSWHIMTYHVMTYVMPYRIETWVEWTMEERVIMRMRWIADTMYYARTSLLVQSLMWCGSLVKKSRCAEQKAEGIAVVWEVRGEWCDARTWISSVLVTTTAPVALAILFWSILRSLRRWSNVEWEVELFDALWYEFRRLKKEMMVTLGQWISLRMTHTHLQERRRNRAIRSELQVGP